MTDVLHLLAVLARDLRHEIYPYVHTKIVLSMIYSIHHCRHTCMTDTLVRDTHV